MYFLASPLSSGTSAIHLALKSIGIKEGDIVFCSSLTFAATINPAIYEKAIPVFIDSRADLYVNTILCDVCEIEKNQNYKLLEKYNFDLKNTYDKLYLRPISELRLEGYISSNIKVTDNHFGYIVITDEIISNFVRNNNMKKSLYDFCNLQTEIYYSEELYVYLLMIDYRDYQALQC